MNKKEVTEIHPGMYVYEDNTILPDIIPNHQIKAIVGYVENDEVYAICLKEIELPWSSHYLAVPRTQEFTEGKRATIEILYISQTQKRQAEAARFCYDFAEDGVKQSEAFLPSTIELENIFANVSAINTSLQKIGAPPLNDRYWSSTEKANNHFAWSYSKQCSSLGWFSKVLSLKVRPVLKIQL